MPVKRRKKPAPSVKYLLSGDRKLQRLRLKRISVRVKKAKPAAARPNRVKPAAAEQGVTPVQQSIGARVIVAGVVCLLAAAALLSARQPAAPLDEVSGASQEALTSPQEAGLATEVDIHRDTPVAPTRSVSAEPARPQAPSGSIEKTPPAAPVKPPTKTVVQAKAASSTAVATAPEPKAPVNDAAEVTVEGCLVLDKETYRLKDTSGLNAPKVRSWRSGFLMKRKSSIDLIAARATLPLEDHVGHRVAATGALMDREMHVRTLREVAGSCR